MNDTQTPPPTTTSPRRLSHTTRIVASALERVTHCECDGPPSVLVLRGFDGDSRRRARHISQRLRARAPYLSLTSEPAPVIAAFGADERHHCAVVDATGRDTQLAMLAWLWRANQPERGRLALLLDDGRELVLDPGQGVDVRPRQAHLEIETIDHTHGDPLCATASTVQVQQVEGLHLLYRDETFVDDAPATVRIVLDDNGMARRVR